MIISLAAWINSQAVRIKAAHVDMLINIPNLMAYNTTNKKIVALGKTEDELKQQSPYGWKVHGRRIGFKVPFDVKAFDPDAAKSVLIFYAYKASNLTRPGTFGQLFGYLADRFNYDVQLAGYESVPPNVRSRFEQLLQKDRNIQRFVINGRVVKGA